MSRLQLLRGWRGIATVAVAAVAFAAPAAAQPEDIVVDANLFWDNDGGNYAGDTGGAACAHGLISNTQLATVLFDNRSFDPLLSDPYDLNAPDWSPLDGSPALSGNANFRGIQIWDLDPFFDEVCFIGAANKGQRWWEGWTYFDYTGGASRPNPLPSRPNPSLLDPRQHAG